MNIGKLDQRITIQSRVHTQDSTGAPSTQWIDVAPPFWANVIDITGKEFMAGNTVQNTVQTKITIRYPGANIVIKSSMRVLHGTDIFNIEAVLGKDKTMRVLMCSTGTNNG